MSDALSRRKFLKWGASAAAVSAASCRHESVDGSQLTAAQQGRVHLPFEAQAIAALADIKPGTPVTFSFPDEQSPCVLVRFGKAVPGGVGPERDVVAYSLLCTHMGCVLNYNQEDHTLDCVCHFSMFDPEKSGQMVCGQATEPLPAIELEYRAQDDQILAVGVHGLIYGRQANLLS